MSESKATISVGRHAVPRSPRRNETWTLKVIFPNGAVRRGVDWAASAGFNGSRVRPLRFSHTDPVARVEFRRKATRGRSRHRLVSGGAEDLGQMACQQVLGGTARDGGV